jgi:hypothetical protein
MKKRKHMISNQPFKQARTISPIRYKFLRLKNGKLFSHIDPTCIWHIGEQKSVEAPVALYEHGFHCARSIIDALSHVRGEILAEVHVSGDCEERDDNEAWQAMTVVRAWYWGKREDVMVALYAARLSLPFYKAMYPEDQLPQQTIQAIQTWLEQPTDANASEVAVCRNALLHAASLCPIAVAPSQLKEDPLWRGIWATESALWAVICAAASVIYPEADAEDAVSGETSPDMREDAIRWANATALRAANVNYTLEELGEITRQMYRKVEEWVQSSLLSQLRPYTD